MSGSKPEIQLNIRLEIKVIDGTVEEEKSKSRSWEIGQQHGHTPMRHQGDAQTRSHHAKKAYQYEVRKAIGSLFQENHRNHDEALVETNPQKDFYPFDFLPGFHKDKGSEKKQNLMGKILGFYQPFLRIYKLVGYLVDHELKLGFTCPSVGSDTPDGLVS